MTPSSASHKQVRIGVIGLGRMGFQHALNVAYCSPPSKLVAACDVFAPSVEMAKLQLPLDTTFYTDPEELFKDSRVDAVIIASATKTHAPLGLAALKAGKHVLMEKPISVDWETTSSFAREAQKYSGLKVMIGMTRRFDESYSDAKTRIEQGQLGRTYMVKAASNDLYDKTGSFVQYAATSGGIFLDAGIHDIDAARWLLGITPSDKVRKVFALGTIVRFKELAEYQDVDNALAVGEFQNGKFFTFHTGRTTTHGHECVCEVFGENGRFIINQNPRLNRLEIADNYGFRSPATPTFYERLKDAFVHELNAFSHCILHDTPVPVTILDITEAGRIAHALTASYKKGVAVLFNEEGGAIGI